MPGKSKSSLQATHSPDKDEEMQNADFNEGAVRPQFSYRPSPVHERSFMILYWDDMAGDYRPYGDYIVLDDAEERELSEKRVINLVGALNQRRNLIDLGEETKSRTHYHVQPGKDEQGRSKVVFYTYTGEGVSRENAVFTFEGDVE
jgi:hypothetical protein